MGLEDASTKELLDELVKRAGVREIAVAPFQAYKLVVEKPSNSTHKTSPHKFRNISAIGPARLLQIID
jgi:hypothetical protein